MLGHTMDLVRCWGNNRKNDVIHEISTQLKGLLDERYKGQVETISQTLLQHAASAAALTGSQVIMIKNRHCYCNKGRCVGVATNPSVALRELEEHQAIFLKVMPLSIKLEALRSTQG